jgi:hypothetical protein
MVYSQFSFIVMLACKKICFLGIIFVNSERKGLCEEEEQVYVNYIEPGVGGGGVHVDSASAYLMVT